jgi:hypothetical protein
MLVDQREELREKRNGSHCSRRLAAANRQGLTLGCEIEVAYPERLRLSDANTRVPKQPHDDAVVVRTLGVEERTVFVWTQEVVGALRTGRRVDRASRVSPQGTICADEELSLLQVTEEPSKRTYRPALGDGSGAWP